MNDWQERNPASKPHIWRGAYGWVCGCSHWVFQNDHRFEVDTPQGAYAKWAGVDHSRCCAKWLPAAPGRKYWFEPLQSESYDRSSW